MGDGARTRLSRRLTRLLYAPHTPTFPHLGPLGMLAYLSAKLTGAAESRSRLPASARGIAAAGAMIIALAGGLTETADASRAERTRAANQIARGLVRSQARSGDLRDQLGRSSTYRYGDAEGGAALLYTGIKYRNNRFIRAGRRAINTTTKKTVDPPNSTRPFKVSGVAFAYNLAKKHLAHRPAVRRDMRRWGSWLKHQETTYVNLSSRHKYENKDLVDAVAVLETQATKLRSTRRGAILGSGRRAARQGALRVINRKIPAMASAFVLSDPDGFNPPAYHSLSFGLYGRATKLLGSKASGRNRMILRKLAETTDQMAGPDGDVAVWGRSGGQKWTMASAAYGLAVTAKLRGVSSADRYRYWALADKLTHRLATYGAGRKAQWITLSLKQDFTAGRKSLTGYERTDEYSGLSLSYLNRADSTLPKARVSSPAAADKAGGRVIGQGRGKFATARPPNGNIWSATKLTGSGNLQYGMGVHAFKRFEGGRWKDVIPAKPTGGGTAGPALVVGKQVAAPYGSSMSAAPDGSSVNIAGGFRGGGVVRGGVSFSVKPHPNGNCLQTTVETVFPGDRYQFSAFFRGNQSPVLGQDNAVYGKEDGQVVGFEGGRVVTSTSQHGLASPSDAHITMQTITVQSNGNAPVSMVNC